MDTNKHTKVHKHTLRTLSYIYLKNGKEIYNILRDTVEYTHTENKNNFIYTINQRVNQKTYKI